MTDPQNATAFDCPNPPVPAEDFADMLAASINRDPSMGDECDVETVEHRGSRLTVHIKGGTVLIVDVRAAP